jgi:deferrochelatase/peroxidase EfeB
MVMCVSLTPTSGSGKQRLTPVLVGRDTRRAGEDRAAGVLDESTVPFYGEHQAGIATPAQDRLAFGVLNLVDGVSRSDVADLLQRWSAAAARMSEGQLVGDSSLSNAPPLDTGAFALQLYSCRTGLQLYSCRAKRAKVRWAAARGGPGITRDVTN